MHVPSQFVACPECAQQPGEPCIGPDGAVLSYVHAKRVEAAYYISEAEGEGKVMEITDEAILNTGLI